MKIIHLFFILIVQGNGDRYFMVSKGDNFQEIRLTAQAAGGLMKMNEAKKDKCYDLRFLKGMMIGFLTVKTIKDMNATADIDEGYLAIMKSTILTIFGFQNEDVDQNIYLILYFTELFEVRVAEDEVRVNGFELLVDEAIGDIKISNFK